jgi:serine/threonine protein kinase
MRQGRILAGKYRLISKLTEGGMGMVWRAEHVELGTPAAVKVLDPTIAESAEALARFKREAQSAASLRSTNIVQIFDFGVDDTLPYIAMELLRGKSLADKLRSEGRMSPAETAAVLSQVARATAWAHSRGIVHRDLKPGNIFLSEDADDIVVKLLDFGIAKPVQLDLSETPVTLTGAIMGTPQYMSPEQASGKKVVDHRTDIWSFAIIAFECLTAQHVFHADTLGGLVLAICTEPMPKPSDFGVVPQGFDTWFARAANRELSQRYSSITEAADALRFVCGADTTGGNRLSYDVTLGAEIRSMNTPGLGINSNRDLRRSTADTPSTRTLGGTQTRHGRPRLILTILVSLVALAAVGSFLRFGASKRSMGALTKSGPLPTTTTTFAPAPLPPGPSPSLQASFLPPAPSSAHSPVKRPPPGKPTPVRVVIQPQASSAASAACDPKVKSLIGICPPPSAL